jgi:hypothetical protein
MIFQGTTVAENEPSTLSMYVVRTNCLQKTDRNRLTKHQVNRDNLKDRNAPPFSTYLSPRLFAQTPSDHPYQTS